MLDEDKFTALNLDAETRARARAALEALRNRFAKL